jgi:hypothetical protein
VHDWQLFLKIAGLTTTVKNPGSHITILTKKSPFHPPLQEDRGVRSLHKTLSELRWIQWGKLAMNYPAASWNEFFD